MGRRNTSAAVIVEVAPGQTRDVYYFKNVR